jgi:LysR family transcriptional regulator, transcriptional activator of nhaA
MINLNYQHLYYFWIVARAPSLTAAANKLQISPSTVSTQIRALEEKLGQDLFERRSRSLILTDRGKVALAYADDIFSLGTELIDTMRSDVGNPNHIYRLRVGVSHHLPKLLTYQLISAAISCENFPVHLVSLQGEASSLVADLAVNHFDIVITDQPVSLASDLPIESRILGECNVHLMATAELAKSLKSGFPDNLEGAPILLPDPDSKMRQLLEDYFHRKHIHPHVIAEISDSALLKSFGQGGAGVFPVPSIAVSQVAKQYNVEDLGPLEGITEHIYASYSASRQHNPAVAAILERARNILLH